jgi:hypothetical protein
MQQKSHNLEGEAALRRNEHGKVGACLTLTALV